MTQANVTEGEAALSVTVVRTCQDASKNEKDYDMTEKSQDTIALSESLRTKDGPRARVTMSVSTKVSDAAQWGPGTWDKINYSVEVFAAVTLECDQDNQQIRRAQNIAYDLAWEANRGHIEHAIVGHDADIRNNLYSGYFQKP